MITWQKCKRSEVQKNKYFIITDDLFTTLLTIFTYINNFYNFLLTI